MKLTRRRKESYRALFPTGPADKDGMTPMVEIEVFYTKGGLNYFTYKNEPRGYMVRFGTLKTGSSGTGFLVEQFAIGNGTGVKFLLETAPRFSEKKLTGWAQTLEPRLESLSTAYQTSLETGDREALRDAVAAMRNWWLDAGAA